ncbi:MAG: hypothetical protein PVJ39_10990 [Gammaproteobacteria bacterium]|jgi:hypothetical protein
MNIFNRSIVSIAAAWLLAVSGLSTVAAGETQMSLFYEFELDQLLHPSAEQLAMEREGKVFVYNGLKDSDIRLALDNYNDRIGSMMFVNVIWTDDNGEPLTDPYTGEMMADDDC